MNKWLPSLCRNQSTQSFAVLALKIESHEYCVRTMKWFIGAEATGLHSAMPDQASVGTTGQPFAPASRFGCDRSALNRGPLASPWRGRADVYDRIRLARPSTG
jgi:hypothetical protein